MTGKRSGSTRASSGAFHAARVSRLSQHKQQTNKRAKVRKQTQSPSVCAPKDFETPKRRSKSRFHGCSNADSPSEAEALQDIIWDPASPPPIWNGRDAGGSVVEISDIVDRIAPNDKKPVDKDSVLQWIGDSVVSCTPEVQRPRVRRISARRQSSNVEDLMKLAKQFDINMTRQDKERDMERLQRSNDETTKNLNNINKIMTNHPQREGSRPPAEACVSAPLRPEGLSHEEELRALFDGPTQHVSGRLSPSSANCSQESRTGLVPLDEKGPHSANSKNIAEQMPEPEFDDDWENDDLLNDSFVLELTQNSELLSAAAERSVALTGPDASRRSKPDSTGSGNKAGTPSPIQDGRGGCYTTVTSMAHCNKTNTFKPTANAPVRNGCVQHQPKASLDSKTTSSKNCQAQERSSRSDSRQQAVPVWKKSETKGSGSPPAKDSDTSAKVESESLWGDGDDDDLLCQVCDDVERISASQEQQKDDCSDLASTKPKSASSTAPSSVPNVQPGQSGDHSQPGRVFARSHSMPGTSSALSNKRDSESAQGNQNAGRQGQYRFTSMKPGNGTTLKAQWTGATSAGTSSVSQHSTFKRHQSDPVALGNKVFVTAQPPVKCTAAEIERKKQEALARRRLRLQANQKPEAAT